MVNVRARCSEVILSIARYLTLLGCLGFSTITMASEPVAIIEDINAPNLKLQMFDELVQGQKLSLGSGTIIIGYLTSCRRETIAGGTVVIGSKKSTVTGGKISHEVVECDGGAMNLSVAEAGKSAVAVFRAPPGGTKSKKKIPKPQITLYGSSPVIRTNSAIETARIIRVDKPDKPIEVKLTGRLTDLAKAQIELERGALYRIYLGDKAIVIKIDALAEPGNSPLLTRLLRF